MQSTRVRQLDLVFALLVIGFAAYIAFISFTPIWPPDLSAFYFAAWFYADGQLAEVYAAPVHFFSDLEAESWRALAGELGHPEADILPYLYPPLWVMVLAPFAKALPPFVFFKLVFVAHIAALGASIFLARRIMAPTKIPAALWALLCVLILSNSTIGILSLYHNQPQIFVSFLVLFSIERLRYGAPVSAGLILALAAALKVTPVLFVVLFVAQRQWRALGAMVCGLAAFGLISWLLVPTELHTAFFERLAQVQSVLPMMHINFSLQSLLGWFFATDQMQMLFAHEEAIVYQKAGWINPVALAIMLIGMAWAWWVGHKLDDTDRYRVWVPLLFIVIYLTGPLSWGHYFLPLILLLPGLATLFSQTVAIVLFVAFALAWSSPLQETLKQLGQTEFYTVQWNVAVLVALFVCLMAAAYRLSRRSAEL